MLTPSAMEAATDVPLFESPKEDMIMNICTLKSNFPEVRESDDLWLVRRILNEHPHTQTLLKGTATYLKRKSGVPIKKAKAIELMAAAMGFKNWNVAKSLLPLGAFDFKNITKRSFEGIGSNTFRLLPSRLFEAALGEIITEIDEGRTNILKSSAKICIISKLSEDIESKEKRPKIEVFQPGPVFVQRLVEADVSNSVRYILRSDPDCVIFHGRPNPDDWKDLTMASLTGHCVLIFADVKADDIPIIKVGEDAAGVILSGL